MESLGGQDFTVLQEISYRGGKVVAQTWTIIVASKNLIIKSVVGLSDAVMKTKDKLKLP